MNNSTTSLGASDRPCAISAADPETLFWLEQGGFVPVILGVVVMFWGISFVCEEFGVPSITSFCKRNNLSDSLTGSILLGLVYPYLSFSSPWLVYLPLILQLESERLWAVICLIIYSPWRRQFMCVRIVR